MPKLRVVIEKGAFSIDVEGAKGTQCRDLTRPFLERLGLHEQDVQEEVKPELLETQEVDEQL